MRNNGIAHSWDRQPILAVRLRRRFSRDGKFLSPVKEIFPCFIWTYFYFSSHLLNIIWHLTHSCSGNTKRMMDDDTQLCVIFLILLTGSFSLTTTPVVMVTWMNSVIHRCPRIIAFELVAIDHVTCHKVKISNFLFVPITATHYAKRRNPWGPILLSSICWIFAGATLYRTHFSGGMDKFCSCWEMTDIFPCY